MQRWMEAAMERAKRNGTMVSGANRPTGDVMEDRFGRRPNKHTDPLPIKDNGPTERIRVAPHAEMTMRVSPVLRKPRGVVVVMKVGENRPKPWGASKAKRREAREAMQGVTFAASSRF